MTHNIISNPRPNRIAHSVEPAPQPIQRSSTGASADVEATLWPERNGWEPQYKPWGPEGDPRRRPKKPPTPTTGTLARLADAVQPWHSLWVSKAIQETRGELDAAIETAGVAAESLNAVEADERVEEAQIRATLTAEPDADVHRTDWPTERVRREVAWAAAFEAAAKTANRYRAVVASEVRRTLPAQLDRIERQREKARKALESVAADVYEAALVAESIHQAEASLKITGTRGWHQFTEADRRQHSRARRDLDGIVSYLRRDDAAATGRWIEDDGPSVPLHTRRALNEQTSTRARLTLERAEADDHVHGRPAISSYTDVESVKHDDIFAAEHLAKKDLPS